MFKGMHRCSKLCIGVQKFAKVCIMGITEVRNGIVVVLPTCMQRVCTCAAA